MLLVVSLAMFEKKHLEPIMCLSGIWHTLKNSLDASSNITDLLILYAGIDCFYFPLCSAWERIMSYLYCDPCFEVGIRQISQFSGFWAMLSYTATASDVWASLNPCLQEHFLLNPCYKAEAIVWAFWWDFLVNHGPFPKLHQKPLLISSLWNQADSLHHVHW